MTYYDRQLNLATFPKINLEILVSLLDVFNIDIAGANNVWQPEKNCIVIKFILAVNASRVIRQLFETNMSLKRTKMTGIKFNLQ